MGVYPAPFTEVMHASVNELLRHVAQSKLLMAMRAMQCITIRSAARLCPRSSCSRMACVILMRRPVRDATSDRGVTYALTLADARRLRR